VKGVKGSLGDATVPGGQLSGTAAPPGPSPGDSPQQDEGITRRVLLGFQRASSAPCVPASFSYTILPIMPRDGALILSEVRVPVLSVVCEPCGRRERYDVERLMRQYGWDAKRTDLLAALTVDCPKTGSVSVYDRCKAVFELPSTIP
jgi:hypothetical protein